MHRLPSYPKVWAIGHPRCRGLFDGDVVVQEKIDGSQFSFGVVDGQLRFRSKGAEIYPDTAGKLFKPAIETVFERHAVRGLVEEWVYRAEAMFRPKHNTLAYNRAASGGLILFDIDTGLERRALPSLLEDEASRMGFECVPTMYEGRIQSPEELHTLLDTESCLGGCKIEGVVVKNYNAWDDRDGKMLMGKYVSEEFKEIHDKEWKKTNPGRGDILKQIIESLATEARWQKAVQKRREAGELENAPQDIGPLMSIVSRDVDDEAQDWIKEQLYKAFRKQITRGATRGLPQWYKDLLLKEAFSADKA